MKIINIKSVGKFNEFVRVSLQDGSIKWFDSKELFHNFVGGTADLVGKEFDTEKYDSLRS